MLDHTRFRYGAGPPIGSAPQDCIYCDAANSYAAYIFNDGAWHGLTVPIGATPGTINFTIDGQGAPLASGIAGDIGPYDFDLTFTRVSLGGNQMGSAVLDLWAAPFPGSYPPTIANSIVGADPPAIVNALASQDLALPGWTTLLPAGYSIRIYVAPFATQQRLDVALGYLR